MVLAGISTLRRCAKNGVATTGVSSYPLMQSFVVLKRETGGEVWICKCLGVFDQVAFQL